MFASYITFDLSPELAITKTPETSEQKLAFVKSEIPEELVKTTRGSRRTGLSPTEDEFNGLLVCACNAKMKIRDESIVLLERSIFTLKWEKFSSELSIDELPGLTTLRPRL